MEKILFNLNPEEKYSLSVAILSSLYEYKEEFKKLQIIKIEKFILKNYQNQIKNLEKITNQLYNR